MLKKYMVTLHLKVNLQIFKVVQMIFFTFFPQDQHYEEILRIMIAKLKQQIRSQILYQLLQWYFQQHLNHQFFISLLPPFKPFLRFLLHYHLLAHIHRSLDLKANSKAYLVLQVQFHNIPLICWQQKQ